MVLLNQWNERKKEIKKGGQSFLFSFLRQGLFLGLLASRQNILGLWHLIVLAAHPPSNLFEAILGAGLGW